MDSLDFHQLSGKWLIRILLKMPKNGSRFTPLQHAVGISPSRLSDNLEKLENLNLVKHLNPLERRHPLLAEYSLTQAGIVMTRCLKSIAPYEEVFPFDIYEKWTLRVLIALTDNSQFNLLKKQLNITPKVLSQRLQKLNDLDIVTKEIISLSPMQIKYSINIKWFDICCELKKYIV